ncbi:hypothetical protein EV1_009635 [Malus domestica]
MFKTASEQNSGNRSLEPQHVQKSKRRLGASETDVSATKDDTIIKIMHARDEYDLPLKDGFSTIALDAHGKNSKDVKSTESEERVTDSESKDKDIKKEALIWTILELVRGKTDLKIQKGMQITLNKEQMKRGTIELLHCLMRLVLILISDKSKSARITSPPVSGNEDIDDLAVLVEEREEVIRGGLGMEKKEKGKRGITESDVEDEEEVGVFDVRRSGSTEVRHLREGLERRACVSLRPD